MVLPVVEEKKITKKQAYLQELKKRAQNLKLEEIDPSLTLIGRLRLERLLQLLLEHESLAGSPVVDLGCGRGAFAKKLKERGVDITAVDVVEGMVESGHQASLNYQLQSLPYLSFTDSAFQGVIFTDVIAEIEPSLFRLTFSEINRIIKKEGWLLCSTDLDVDSYDAYERFVELVETEFTIIAEKTSSHRLYVSLIRLAKAPLRFLRAAKEPDFRLKHIMQRRGLMRLWFYLNSLKLVSLFWRPFAYFLPPCLNFLKQSQKTLILCEKLSKIIWRSGSITHVILLARKKKI